MNNKLAILMATYNGEKYIKEQIESILSQTYQEFDVYIRDDNSKDNTLNIINEYARKYPNKIFIVKDENIAKGAYKNFMLLLEYVKKMDKYDLFMFSDQDDVWLKNKVEIVVNKYNEQLDKNMPILIHTDLYVVDKDLNIISNSFVKYSKLRSDYTEFNKYLVQNNVTGCTMLINKKLVNLVNFKIEYVIMHDWYFALIASSFGKVIYIDKPTINYRQHGDNTVGAKSGKGIKYLYSKISQRDNVKESIKNLYKQSQSFKEIYYDKLNDKNKKVIMDFLCMENNNRIYKIKTIIKNKMYKQGIIRIIGEFIYS